MTPLSHLLNNNRDWSIKIQNDTKFSRHFVKQQSPEYLWISCSEIKVAENEVIGLLPDEIYSHCNMANIVAYNDISCISVIQYAVDILQVKHIIVCGHYGCGGVTAALNRQTHGLIDNWLEQIRDIYRKHENILLQSVNRDALVNHLCELNVIEQVKNVIQSSVVQNAWHRNQSVCIHGWILSETDGLLKDLMIPQNS